MYGLSKISMVVGFFCMVGPAVAQRQASDLPAGRGGAAPEARERAGEEGGCLLFP